MRPNSVQKVVITATVVLFCCNAAWGGLRSYEVYQPTVTRGFILDKTQSPLQYNHGSAITYYRGQFYAFWNANTHHLEGQDGQRLYMSTSPDGMTWSQAELWTPDNGPQRRQWQPVVVNYNNDESLWVFWYETGGPFWFSRMEDPADGWTHTRLFIRTQMPDGLFYHCGTTQEPLSLDDGRVFIPVVWAQEAAGSFWDAKKFAAVLHTNDGAQTFDMKLNTFVYDPEPAGTNIFETMLVRQYDNKIRLFGRNLDRHNAAQDELFMTSLGDEDAQNFETIAHYTAVRTVSSRGWVQEYDNRRIMFLHDSANGSTALAGHDRKNIALFFSRSGLDDFVAGVPIVEYEPEVAYPQGVFRDGKLYFSYSYQNSSNIRWGIVDPLPDAESYYIFPRGTDRRLTDYDPDPEVFPIEARIEPFVSGNRQMLRFYGNASAGVDVDVLVPEQDTLTVVLPVKVESTDLDNPVKLLSVGDGPVEVGYFPSDPLRYHIRIDGQWHDAGPFIPGRFNTLVIVINNDGIVTRNNGVTVNHAPAPHFSGRIYLGDGYPDSFLDESVQFILDVQGFGTKVEPTGAAGVCGDVQHPYPTGDLNYDCVVDIADFAILAENWLKSTVEGN